MVVLVSYATRRSCVQAIAERLAARLRLLGIATEPRPVTDPVDVDAYDGVILGSAMQAGQWLPEAIAFVSRHTAVLLERPTWLFSVSAGGDHVRMFHARPSQRLREIHRECELVDGLRQLADPREYRYFAGRFGDHHDWTAIDAWAVSLAADLTSLTRAPVELAARRG